MNAKYYRLGEVIDALVSRDYTGRGISHELYEFVRKREDSPLCMSAAEKLNNVLHSGSRVMIFTGWPSRSWLVKGLTETDGPVGAAILARALEEGYGVIPLLVMAPNLLEYGKAALRAAGLIVSDLDTALCSKPGPPSASVSCVIPLSTDWQEAENQQLLLFEKIKPEALISIELPGITSDGTYHNVTGRVVPNDLVMKADVCFRAANKLGILTIGIGDGGNELGMANASPAICEYLKEGSIVAPETTVNLLIVACISNWGALGIAACIAAIKNNPQLFQHIDICRITDKVCDAGAIDGLSAYVDPKNDGTSQQINQSLSNLMEMVLEMHLGGWKKG